MKACQLDPHKDFARCVLKDLIELEKLAQFTASTIADMPKTNTILALTHLSLHGSFNEQLYY